MCLLRLTLSVMVAQFWFSSSTLVADVYAFCEPYRQVQVATAESGIITDLTVREGTVVTRGQPLAQLDTDLYESLLAIAQAEKEATGRLDAARSDVALRQGRVEALQGLHRSGHARYEELEQAVTELDVAQGQLQSAMEALRIKELEFVRIQTQVARRTVRAPMDGVVIELGKEEGEFIAPHDPTLLTLVQLNPLVATFDVAPHQADVLQQSKRAAIEVEGKGVVEVGIEFISPIVNAESTTVRVKVRIPNSHRQIRSGVRCRLVEPRSAAAGR